MNNTKDYRGIDLFRLIAAFLIIAIHTSPLSTYSEIGDFILTRIIGRMAVPFFFMTSGFFLISRYSYNEDKLKAFVKKTVLLYGIAIFIYIPLNLYNEYFKMDNLLPNIIKDLLFDGTFYHLWYLPAAALGGAIAWFFVKRVGFQKAFLFTLMLYVFGLFGDSYYGIIENIPVLREVYEGIFELSDYTRNGIFLAPVFFVLGGIVADKSIHLSLRRSLIWFAASFLLMFGEGIMLHSFHVQRHDSMYVFLIPCAYFLLQALTFWRGKRSTCIRTWTLVLYIIHPMMIVVVRLFAKILGMEAIFIENSLLHYLSVSALSVIFAVVTVSMYQRIWGRQRKASAFRRDRAWIEINYQNLKENVKTLKKAMPKGCEMMAVVKAEAYGHGAYETATYINRLGVKAFAVATIDEGINLRRYGIRDKILILGFTPPQRAKELHKYNLMQTLLDEDYALQLNSQGYKVKAHLKIDTGMHRLGYDWRETNAIQSAFKLKHIEICGIFTHLCSSDSLAQEDVAFTQSQIQHFYQVLQYLKRKGIKIPKTHIQSSYGLLNYPDLKCDYVRVGIALYGVLSSPADATRQHLDLRPVLSFQSQIILLRRVAKGESVGYGRAFKAQRESLIGVISAGYADGIPRNLSCGKGEVLVNGQLVPVVGRICMDQLIIDVTDVTALSVGDVVTLIGEGENGEISASQVAERTGSISNELLSRMGPRVKIRVHHER